MCKKFLLFVFCTMCVWVLYAQSLQLKFVALAGQQPLVLLDSTYHTTLNEPVTFRNFLFYISHIQLKDDNGHEIPLKNEYYLINATDAAFKAIDLPVKPQHIASITFTVGVDSIKNVSGIQTGSLDPMRGMFWTWNTGYIFAKLEGNSPASKAPAHYVTYHIGGYKHNENALRVIHFNLPQKKSVHQINIGADVLAWFNKPHPLSIQEHPICHSPGKLAMQIADNYAQMFHIINVE